MTSRGTKHYYHVGGIVVRLGPPSGSTTVGSVGVPAAQFGSVGDSGWNVTAGGIVQQGDSRGGAEGGRFTWCNEVADWCGVSDGEVDDVRGPSGPVSFRRIGRAARLRAIS